MGRAKYDDRDSVFGVTQAFKINMHLRNALIEYQKAHGFRSMSQAINNILTEKLAEDTTWRKKN